MRGTLKFAVLGAVLIAYAGLVCFCLLRGWRGDAIEMGAVIPAVLLGVLADRRRCCGWGKRRCGSSEAEER
jgi:hypothetical protein